MKQQQGFTLVELIVVIVILGILAAVAVPKFVDMETDAYDAHAKAVAGSLASWSAMNYGKVKISANGGTPVTSDAVCATIGGALSTYVTGDTTGIAIADPDGTAADNCTAAGDTIACKVSHSSGSTAGTMATLICTAAYVAPSQGG